ncbi:hypothetical protein JYB87_04650 [Shewanella avicenniae]|uniref:LysR substrate binding domain-containing protein n=1 Tax=Shewanella avicenniae TaxID=2814294 RepID=A0ABX7QUL5_9GAMM|nr:hypothetical protein [Shewanella avicenniae]QSX34543.1 hypothetical protein JYB87_04650 [Shewanella avicenniae]
MNRFTYQQIEAGEHLDLIRDKKSFEVVLLEGHLSDAVQLIERHIESRDMSCRIYTSKRVATATIGLLDAGLGIAALAGIAIHNIATYNPDWEICRYLVDKKIEVTYMK